MKKINANFRSEFPFFMALPAVAWQFFFCYVPVVCLILLSFLRSGNTAFDTQAVTLENYTYFFSPLFALVIGRSLLLAFCTAFFCLLFAYPVSYCLAIKIRRFKNIFLFFLILPFWTSFMVQAYAWFFVLEHNGLINTILLNLGVISAPLHLLNTTLSIYIVMVYCYLPFMIMPLYTALEKIDRRFFEAAADLGATQWQTFTKLTIPLSMPGIKTGFFLVFVPAFGEFVIPTLLGGGKKLFVGSLISQYFFVARNPNIGSAFTVITCIVLLMAVGLLYWFFNRKTVLTLTQED